MQLLIFVFYDKKGSPILYQGTHYGELNYVNTNWYEVVLERTCQDICSARTTQLDIWVLYCIVWRFAWIRNRQYRQLRRLCCEILIHSVFTLPEPLLSASYCILFCCSAVTTGCSTAAVPSVRIYDYPGWANVMWSTLSRL